MTQEVWVKQTILAALSDMSCIPVLDLKGEKKQQQQQQQNQQHRVVWRGFLSDENLWLDNSLEHECLYQHKDYFAAERWESGGERLLSNNGDCGSTQKASTSAQ